MTNLMVAGLCELEGLLGLVKQADLESALEKQAWLDLWGVVLVGLPL